MLGIVLEHPVRVALAKPTAAAKIVKDGGTIVCAAECRDGFPGHGRFRELLGSRETPAELIESITTSPRTIPDQWQVQVQANIQSRATVHLYTDHLTDDEVREAHLEPTHDIAATVRDALDRAGPASTVCVLPEGPQTIPILASETI